MWTIWIEFFRWHSRHHQHEYRDRDRIVWLIFPKFAVQLPAKRKEHILRQLHIDQIDTISIAETDVDGNLILPPEIFDASPVWSNSDDTVARLTIAGNAQSAILAPSTVGGVTTVTVQATIGGTVFQATADYTIVAGSVAAIELMDTTSPKPTM